ncbi:DUF6541 family protein [Chloroflexus aggregans]|uniref:Glycosyltransferase RgtA/B/C/D-like domain-containing protein n=1 Tax=Chloroflexus aggregans (strain MD-66 / DSM 9485) TaxID=326427 RepID=B8G439_CHLAD|nr:DUF6541 family protein [Chloroflexus aggregans]ACL25441.1 conserved hypothetical protein [Chloroflexus aggregans DSM 9485]
MIAGKLTSSRTTIWLAAIWLAAMISIAVPGLLWWLPWSFFSTPLVVISGGMLFTLPGLALLRWLHPSPLHGFERLAYSASLSCAVLPLILLFSEPIGWRWNGLSAWLVIGGCAVLALWPQTSAIRRTAPASGNWRQAALPIQPRHHLIGWVLIFLTGAACAVRLFLVRDVPLGFYGDSYHHTVITQLLIDHGGLFRSWEPYAPAVTFTYHYAFHAMGAWWHWLAGIPATQAVIWTGQVMNGLAVPLMYLLSTRLTNSRLTGLWAAVIVGFVSVYPAYYVNWGRYTQLAGQTVLPAAAMAWLTVIDGALHLQRSWRQLAHQLVLAIITGAGLAVSHYRVAILAICLLVAYTVTVLVTAWPIERRSLIRFLTVGAIGAIGALLLALPWLWRVREGQITRLATNLVLNNSEASNPFSPETVGAAFQHGLFPLAALGLGSLLWRRQLGGIVLALWAGFAWVAANPQLIGLNGQGLITSFTVLIGAYMAIAPAAGAGIVALFRLIARLMITLPRHAATALVAVHLGSGLLIVGWGSYFQATILDPAYQLATPADLKAAAWIRDHLPPDAAVFVNGFAAYGGYVYAGSDGGWWLTLLTGRRTNLLPMAVGFEAIDPPNMLQIIREQHQAVQQFPIGSAEAAAALRSLGFAYLYNGPAANPPGEYLDPAQIDATPLYELIYRQDGVSIWRIR